MFTCIQAKPSDPKCLPKAETRCAGAVAKLDDGAKGIAPRLLASVTKACQTSGLTLADALDATGVGFSTLEPACTAAGVPSILNGVPNVAQCVTTYHECRAGQMLEAEMPRLRGLLSLAHVTLP